MCEAQCSQEKNIFVDVLSDLFFGYYSSKKERKKATQLNLKSRQKRDRKVISTRQKYIKKNRLKFH